MTKSNSFKFNSSKCIKRIAFLLYITSIYSTCYTQNIDSLKSILSIQEGVNKAETLIQIGEAYDNKYSKVDSLLLYSTKAYKYASSINEQLIAFRALSNIGLAYAKQNDFKTSNFIWNKLLEQNKVRDAEFLGNLHFRIGLIANFENKDAFSMDNYIKALKYFEEVNDKDGVSLTYGRIAYLFSTQKQFDKVISYCRQAMNKISSVQNQFTKVSVLSTITGLYIQVGTEKEEYIDSAIYYGNIAISLAIKNEYYGKGSQISNSISAAYNIKGNNNKAIEYLQIASQLFNPYIYKGEAIITYLNLSDAYAGLKKYKESLQYLDSASSIAIELKDLYYDMAVSERIYAYNKEYGDYRTSLIGLEQFKQLEDSIYNENKIVSINEINTKYQTELKDAEIKYLNQSKKIDQLKIFLLIIAFILALLGGFLAYIIFRNKALYNEQKVNEAELRLSRSRINPHFFFNAMAALQSQALNEKDNTKVALYLSKYAKIMRLTLEGSYSNLVTIESELDFITQYMDIQKLRTQNKFQYKIEIEDGSGIELLKIPSMILQPFVENSIEHGFANIDYLGEIVISIKETNNQLEIIIDDNGMTESMSNRNLKEFPSRATSIIKDRLFLLSKKIKKHADFEMMKKQDANGFVVKLNFPIIEE